MSADDPHLLIKEEGRDVVQPYVLGKAAVNYDDTLHSAQPGVSKHPLFFMVFVCGEASMTPKQQKNAIKYVKDTAIVYYANNGSVEESDEVFYDSD